MRTRERIHKNLQKKIGLSEGMALTPECHDRAVEEALKELAK